MAGASLPTHGHGRKRSLDAEINLVPFIDLLSMCICFLLMTAVWMELGTINVKQMIGTDGPSTQNLSDLEVKFLTPERLEVSLKAPGKALARLTVEALEAKSRGEKLSEAVRKLAQDPKTIGTAKISTKQGVNYGELVSVMDVLRREGVSNLGIVPVR
ncbi:MAG: biopolymer transporter ExbD [Oligoflexia bacterium]|nr:biopolymer transporter ExbD [Oligoflexia bacterium]